MGLDFLAPFFMNKQDILKAYQESLNGELSKLTLDLEIYLKNPTSIPEHTSYSQYLDDIVKQIAEINDKIKVTDFLIKQYG